jgi:2,3-bisphosphoglycerate-independent phosphoglycerate mutase
VKLLFIFLDGVGLGENNPENNPFARIKLPNFEEILGGHKLIADGYQPLKEADGFLAYTERSTLLALDPCLGINGLPQSATGQAALFTGVNVPARLGYHEGPKPTPPIVELICQGTLLTQLQQQHRTVSLLNAFPPRYFNAIKTGYRLPGVIALTAQQAGSHLNTITDLLIGEALSADFTAEGWRDHLGYPNIPILTPFQAGERLNILADKFDLAIFEYWLTDMAGHHQDMPSACTILETLDGVMGSLFNAWDGDEGLILLTSDHGNLEDLGTRHHTNNDVPLLLVGSHELRKEFIGYLNQSRGSRKQYDLTDITPAILNFIG